MKTMSQAQLKRADTTNVSLNSALHLAVFWPELA